MGNVSEFGGIGVVSGFGVFEDEKGRGGRVSERKGSSSVLGELHPGTQGACALFVVMDAAPCSLALCTQREEVNCSLS